MGSANMSAWMSGWVHQTPVSTTATRTERSPSFTFHAVGAPIDWRPHWSTKNGSLGVSSAWTGKFVTTADATTEPAAAPDTNAPAMTRTATMAASRRARALNRADNRGSLRDFEGWTRI